MLNFSCKELSFLSSYLGWISSYIQAFYLATSDGFLATYRPHLATGCFPELAAVSFRGLRQSYLELRETYLKLRETYLELRETYQKLREP